MRETETVLYGELVVLGTDGELPNGNRGRRRSRYQVFQIVSIFRLFFENSKKKYETFFENFEHSGYPKKGNSK